MGDLLEAAVAKAAGRGATYAEARTVRLEREVSAMVNGRVEAPFASDSEGLGVRVLVDGGWGFAAVEGREPEGMTTAVDRAIELARHSARCRREPVVLAPLRPTRGEHRDVGRRDPLSVSRAERVEVLRATRAAVGGVSNIVQMRVQMDLRREHVELRTSEGTHTVQEIGVVGGGFAVTAEVRGTRTTRSFPHHGGWDYAVGGYEWLEGLDLPVAVGRLAREAVELTGGRPCPRAVTTVVVDPTMVGMILHETLGHPAELDRALGDELDNFGPSFLTPDKYDRYPYGSPLVSLTADATMPRGAGSFGFDDEGVPAQRFPLVSSGILRASLMSRESAARIGRVSNGTARASSWDRIPMARITNLVLEPGSSSLERLIADVDEGLYIHTFRTADIDDKRLLCSFGGEIGWEIRHGRLGGPIRSPIMFTNTPSLWRQCDGIGSAQESRITGISGCGKALPWQFIRTGQGGPPARFRNVQVGLP